MVTGYERDYYLAVGRIATSLERLTRAVERLADTSEQALARGEQRQEEVGT